MTTAKGAGDRDGQFEAIYRKNYARVWRFFRASRISDDEAHDLAQDVFQRFFEAWESYRGEAVWAYLEKTALNLLSNRARARKTAKRTGTHVEIDDPQQLIEPVAPQGPDYAEREQMAIRLKSLRDAIAALPEGQRECQLLRLSDLSYDEIAAALGITLDAVRSRLRDAKKQLRAKLGADLLPEDDQ